MESILFLIGAIATVALIINNVARTALRQHSVRLIEIGLAFFAVLMPASALIVENVNDPAFDTLEQAVFLLVIPLAISHLGLTIVESFRKQGLRSSRGLLGLGTAVLLALTTTYNFVALNASLSASDRDVRPTPVNETDTRDPCTVAGERLAFELLDVLENATGREIEPLLEAAATDGSLSLAALTEANGNDPGDLIQELNGLVGDGIRDLLALECLGQAQATAALGLSRTLIRRIVLDDFNSLQIFISNFAGNAEGETAADLSEAELQATRVALLDAIPDNITEPPSPTPTFTPSRTPSPTPTRTPFPTQSATPTRQRFVTATPTLTPTLPTPCLGTAYFNVNMRDAPSLEEGEILLTIPFDAVFPIYGPNEDRTWWYGQYEGEVGWISDEFIGTPRICDDLPVQD